MCCYLVKRGAESKSVPEPLLDTGGERRDRVFAKKPLVPLFNSELPFFRKREEVVFLTAAATLESASW